MKVEYKQLKINKNWIEKNITGICWQRKIYSGRVNFFINHMKNNTFREHSSITLWKNSKNNVCKILDGQHKIEAIKNFNSEFLMDLRIISDISFILEVMIQQKQQIL